MTNELVEPAWCDGYNRCILLKDHAGECTPNFRIHIEGVDSGEASRAEEARACWLADKKFRQLAPKRYWDVPEVENLDLPDSIKEPLDRWAERAFFGDTVGALILLGGVGCGKTHTAYSVLRYITFHRDAAGHEPAATSAVDMLRRLRPDGGKTIDDYTKPHVLLIDDIGIEKPSEWTEEVLFAIFDARWRDMSITILTSNLTPSELKNTLGTRVYDRIRDGALAITIPGSSKRSASVSAI